MHTQTKRGKSLRIGGFFPINMHRCSLICWACHIIGRYKRGDHATVGVLLHYRAQPQARMDVMHCDSWPLRSEASKPL